MKRRSSKVITSILILILFSSLCLIGYKKFMYRYSAERYFLDSNVVEFCKAAKAGNKEKIDRLIAEGVDVNTLGENDINPLHWLFISNKDTEEKKQGFRYLLEQDADPLKIHKPVGWTVLHLAASYDDSDYLRMILEVQPDINIDFEFDETAWNTPLLQAKTSHRYENFKMLLDHGADIEKQNHWGQTPLSMTSGNGTWMFAYHLLQRNADFTNDTENGKSKIVRSLEGLRFWPSVSINYRGLDYRQKVVEFLREKGVEVNPWMPEDEEYRYEDGVAVLYIREENGDWIKFKDSDRYDPNDFDPGKQTPLE